jgi:hypothetical protein
MPPEYRFHLVELDAKTADFHLAVQSSQKSEVAVRKTEHPISGAV